MACMSPFDLHLYSFSPYPTELMQFCLFVTARMLLIVTWELQRCEHVRDGNVPAGSIVWLSRACDEPFQIFFSPASNGLSLF
jgi:hypothetical protein